MRLVTSSCSESARVAAVALEVRVQMSGLRRNWLTGCPAASAFARASDRPRARCWRPARRRERQRVEGRERIREVRVGPRRARVLRRVAGLRDRRAGEVREVGGQRPGARQARIGESTGCLTAGDVRPQVGLRLAELVDEPVVHDVDFVQVVGGPPLQVTRADVPHFHADVFRDLAADAARPRLRVRRLDVRVEDVDRVRARRHQRVALLRRERPGAQACRLPQQHRQPRPSLFSAF